VGDADRAAANGHRPYRVIQWGTGNTGSRALRFLLEDAAFQVRGVWVGREENRGRVAGDLVGLPGLGPRTSSDVDEIIGIDADCVVYMPKEPRGLVTEPGSDGWRSVEIICRLLESGKNVVSSGISGLTNPRIHGAQTFSRLQMAAATGGTTFFNTGIEPGFMCDALALTLTSVSRNIRSVRTQEIINYATYAQPSYHASNGGIWGAPCHRASVTAFRDRLLDAGMAAPVRTLADALRIDLDEITAEVEFEPAPETFDVAMGRIDAGTIAAYRFQILGQLKGRAAIAVEHVTRLNSDVAPQWPDLDPGGFRVIVDGTPSFVTEISFVGDANVGACTGTAARAVNSVPIVVEAPAGVCSFLDLPTISAAGSAG
jgi:2,4-diaminopentanoate dehydrogenase